MPKVGDGTGLGAMPPEEEGLKHTGGDEPEKPGGNLNAGNSSHPMHEGPHRTTYPEGGGSGKKD